MEKHNEEATVSQSNIVKRRSGEKLEGKEKQIIFNVFNYLRAKNPERSVSRTVENTAEATGCSTQTIFRIRKEAASGSFRSPSKTKPRKNINKNSRLIKYDDSVRSIIRSKVHDCLFKNLPLTLNSVMTIVNEDPELPNFKRSTLHKVLNEMGFKYEKKGKHAMYIEKNDLINARHAYLKEIRKLRHEKRNIIYMGEVVIEINATGKNFNNPNTIGSDDLYNAASNNVIQKYIIIQAANENGFIKDGDLVYIFEKKLTPEDEETDTARFEDWLKNRLLISLPPSTIIVIDNSSQHRWRNETIPDKSWQRDKIREWLTSKRLSFKEDLLKKDLLEIVASVKRKYSGYQMEEFVQNHGHTILKLPPHHCELSPLGMVWNQVKQYINIHSNVNDSSSFERVIWEALRCINLDMWRMQLDNVLKVEESMWRADTIQEEITKDGPIGQPKEPVTNVASKSDIRDPPSEQAHWFSDFMRLRAGEGYHQYFGEHQQSTFDLVK